MEWFKKHADAIAIMAVMATSMVWMSSQLNELNSKLASLDKDLAVIKTVLVMQKIMPNELCAADKKEDE